jgi:NAD(P)-dependent dehydrogenase (short-subunit alcohol dehydrogenase family)
MALRFDGKVVLVTGAGNGLGRAYALEFARRGAKVVVNDLGGSRTGEGASASAADQVVNEIRALGGTAVANYDSVEFGARIVQAALEAFGRIDVIVNNAGILRDKSFEKMSDDDWNLVLKVHLQGVYSITKAAWPHMKKQKYGRVLNVSSASGIYGNFGQSNYAAAKTAIIGLTNVIGKEGVKYNIHVNIIAPHAESRMTTDVLSEETLALIGQDKVVPMAIWLTHESCPVNISLFELGGGLYTQIRNQRSAGLYLSGTPTAERLRDNWGQVVDFSEPDYPTHNSDFPIKLDEKIRANKTVLRALEVPTTPRPRL